MLREETRYICSDESEWRDHDKALKREALIAAVVAIQQKYLNGPRSEGVDEGTFVAKHNPDKVKSYKVELLKLVCRSIDVSNLVEDQEFETVNPFGIFGRIIDDSQISPLNRAWHRLMCIDAEGLEWQQPHYVLCPKDRPKTIKIIHMP